MERPKRKKGRAEKLRSKRMKNLTVDAARCAKSTDMFAGGAAVASTSSVTAMLQQQHFEGEDSSSGQERSGQRCRLTDRETEGQSEWDSVVQLVSR